MLKATTLFIFIIIFVFTYKILPATEGKSPSEVVTLFCELDYNGTRTDSSKAYPYTKLMSWFETENGGGPGWDSTFIISGYKITGERISEGKAFVTVIYRLLALESPDGICELGIDNIEEFQLATVNGEWRITNTILFPRISLDLAIAHDQDLLNGYKKSGDTQTVERLEKSLMRLYRMKPYADGASSN